MQLEHITEERTRNEHGFVTVLYDGETLTHNAEFQHNKNYRSRFELADAMMEVIVEAMNKKAPAAPAAAPEKMEVATSVVAAATTAALDGNAAAAS